MRTTAICALLALSGVAASAAAAERVILQIFDTEWDDIERRAADIFLSGYGAVWLPPPSKASDAFSVGFDVFNRFDLGKPPLSDSTSGRARTAYGTEATFGAMVDELQRADVHVYIDTVLNHNSGRSTSDAFLADGGWPGFWLPRESPPRDKLPTDDWGDFHSGNGGGYLQSENPGAPNYNLWRGDLVALVDIQQDRSNMFIRQPTEAGNPQNIPAGNIRNRPDPENARFYPDRVLTPEIFVNPASRHSGAAVETRYPFNLNNPMGGDPVVEDSTGYLRRWLQWMLQVQNVDGFRLDASKHVFPWWWDTHFDSAVFNGRTDPAGNKITPFSFGENTTGNFDVLANYYRKDAFANRDSLDLFGAGKLRNLIGGGGFGSWADIFSNADTGHLDQADDGFQNGSAGVFHVFSHDNGSVGDGGSLPPLPTNRQQGWFAHAYMLMRPGLPIVYYNGRGVQRSFGFFPREGTPVALGWDPITQSPEDVMTTLVDLHNGIAVGDYYQRNGNIADVLVFERANNPGGGLVGNVLVAVNDRYDAGVDSLSVNTTFPQGTRLVEYTGNAANPQVDPAGVIPEVITVGPNGSVSLNVPRNSSSAGEHNRGFLVYAPAVPDASITIVGQDGVVPADPVFFPDFLQRLNEIPVVTADSFTLRVETVPGDSVDQTTDDNTLFKIDDGALDWNGNGGPDVGISDASFSGFEEFTDVKSPGMSNPDREGLYEQAIDATRLSEGFHYIRTVSFRQRPAGTGPLADEERAVVYIDRLPPDIDMEGDGQTFTEDQPTFRFLLNDKTPEVIYAFLNLEPGEDPLTMLTTPNAARRYDRYEWRNTFDETLQPGENTVTIVAVEPSGRQAILEYTVFYQTDCAADLAAPFGVLDLADINAFIAGFVAQDPAADLAAPFGVFDLADINAFVSAFAAGCP
jgi:glycosidase